MTVEEMMEYLSSIAEEIGGDTEVRLAMQPNWPLQSEIENLLLSREYLGEEDPEEIESGNAEMENTKYVVFVVEGSPRGYLSGLTRKELGWW